MGARGLSAGDLVRTAKRSQLNLFAGEQDAPAPAPESKAPLARRDWRLHFSRLLAKALKEAKRDRAGVAAEMTRLLAAEGVDAAVTVHSLASWTRSDPAWQMPAFALPAFIEATGAYWLHDELAARNRQRVVSPEQLHALELGQLTALRAEVDDRVRRLLRFIGAEPRQ